MRVLHVCAEVFPILKTGGLADAAAALPLALSKIGCDVRLLVPGFPAFHAGLQDKKKVITLPARFGAHDLHLYIGRMPDSALNVYFIDAPGLYDREGNPYADSVYGDYGDNYRRFALLGWMAARLAEGVDAAWSPEIVHAHDWHAGLTPAYIKAAEQAENTDLAGTVFTAHNLAYQGNFPADIFDELDLPAHYFQMDGLEFYQQVSFMKAGLVYADKVATVSPTYAKEIQRPEQSHGFDGVLQQRQTDLSGILNGVDDAVWNPSTDDFVPANYSAEQMSGKAACKAALQAELGFEVNAQIPLMCVISRLASQKGLDLILAALPEILEMGVQMAILGNGDPQLEEAYRHAAFASPEQVAVHIGFDETRSHQFLAGADVILMPSRYEPCGLTQLYGMRYGTIPIVHRVGGLADTVDDCVCVEQQWQSGTGFCFDHFDPAAFVYALQRCVAVFKNAMSWQKLQQQAMAQRYSWVAAAEKYLAIYESIKMKRE